MRSPKAQVAIARESTQRPLDVKSYNLSALQTRRPVSVPHKLRICSCRRRACAFAKSTVDCQIWWCSSQDLWCFQRNFVGSSPTGTAQPLPQLDESLRRLEIQNDGSSRMLQRSGGPSAGWFPLPDAVRGLLGCHTSVPPLSVFVDLRAAWGHVGCGARNMRAVVGD